MQIRIASAADISLISKLAFNIWPAAYQSILSAKQIDFMLNDMYSVRSLEKQFNEGITFLIAEIVEKPVAFASYSLSDQQHSVFKIHKLYISPE